MERFIRVERSGRVAMMGLVAKAIKYFLAEVHAAWVGAKILKKSIVNS